MKSLIALAALAMLTSPTFAASCKDPKTKKYISCPPAAAAPAPIKCKDGTTSNAKTRKGACSKHGGIA